jgi:hypothetical protein
MGTPILRQRRFYKLVAGALRAATDRGQNPLTPEYTPSRVLTLTVYRRTLGRSGRCGRFKLSSQDLVLASAASERPRNKILGQRHDLIRDRFHDLFVFLRIRVPVIHTRNSALAMILNPVHRIAPKAKRSDRCAVGPS